MKKIKYPFLLTGSILGVLTLPSQAGRPIVFDSSSFFGNGTFNPSYVPNTENSVFSGSSLGSVEGTFTGTNGIEGDFTMKYQVFGGGTLSLSQAYDDGAVMPTVAPNLLFQTSGIVTGIEYEFFFEDQIGPRWRSRVTGFSLNQRTGSVSGSATATYYNGDGSTADIELAITDGTGDIDQSIIWSKYPNDDLIAFNSTITAPGVITTTDTLSLDETIDGVYTPRFGVAAGKNELVLGGQEVLLTANGSSFEDGSIFSFTFDGSSDGPTSVTPFTSTISVPEPSSFLLLGLGSLALGLKRRR